MAPQPEQHTGEHIDRLLEAAGWHVCDADKASIHEFPLPGYGSTDYLLYIDGKAAGVETQSDKYTWFACWLAA